MNFIKKIRLYLTYKRIIKKHKKTLAKKGYEIDVDYIGRMYTVVNLPQDVVDYGHDLAQSHIQKYIQKVDSLFFKIGLNEYVGIYDIRREGDLDYVVIFGFKFLDMVRVINNLITFLFIALVGFFSYLIFF